MRKPMRKQVFRRLVMRRSSLQTRNGIYYAELVAPGGRKLTARSTGKNTEDEALMDLLDGNPHAVDNPFVFYGLLENKPMDNKILVENFHAVCKAARGIVFHSHRHYYAAQMADIMTADQITRITGHKSRAVFEQYADHVIDENLEAMAEAAAQSFGKIVTFRNGA
jgi:hypothetical protein